MKKIHFENRGSEIYVAVKDLEMILNGARKQYVKMCRARAKAMCENGDYDVRKAEDTVTLIDKSIRQYIKPIVETMEQFRSEELLRNAKAGE